MTIKKDKVVDEERLLTDLQPNRERIRDVQQGPEGPRKNLSRGAGEWNHYYVRGINGEVRLWVNGEEVSGGSGAEPRTGYLCLEAERSPVEFRNIRVREVSGVPARARRVVEHERGAVSG